ncbi:MAG: ABC transporter ATP-binding protein [Acidobacteria bacterium]|jgi:iron complex transport system ATP-binding protein|nr:ABC transporter ATP-binding protein [Acidobacteriota bacterium]
MTDAALSFENLGFAYKPGTWVFRGYKGVAHRGQVLAILGPNGCGKTTLLKLLTGILCAQEGLVRRNGQMGFVPQLFQVRFSYSVFDMVLMGRARRVGLFSVPSAHDENIAMESLRRLGIDNLADRAFDELSGGQRQLAIFARALAAEADILVLDEPTSALDLKNQGFILDWIRRLAREENLTVVFTTHHPDHAYAVADLTLLMLDACDFLCGSTRAVMTEDRLHQLYGTDLKRLRFEHKGQTVETFVPVYGAVRHGPTE